MHFVVDDEPPANALSCNCTHCRRKGVLLTFVPRDQVTITAPDDGLREYLFNTHKIRHQFCTVCGVEPFAFGEMPSGDPVCALNLRCVMAIDLDALELDYVDGLAT